MDSEITTHVSSTDGTIYLRTQHGDNAQVIADALRPYIGHVAAFYPPNLYGHINPHQATRARILAVEGTRVTFHVHHTGYTGDVDAFEGFGSYCTTVYPKEQQA